MSAIAGSVEINSVANGRGPNFYLSGIQYSRLFALCYLDDFYRNPTEKNFPNEADRVAVKASFEDAMAQELAMIKDEKDFSAQVDKLLGGKDLAAAFKKKIANWDAYFQKFSEQRKYLVPTQSFTQAFEENLLWAATNSVAYLIAIHKYCYKESKKVGNEHLPFVKHNIYTTGPDGEEKIQPEFARTIIMNILFWRVVLLDDIPSVIDGYTFEMIDALSKNPAQKNSGITLPSNASTC